MSRPGKAVRSAAEVAWEELSTELILASDPPYDPESRRGDYRMSLKDAQELADTFDLRL